MAYPSGNARSYHRKDPQQDSEERTAKNAHPRKEHPNRGKSKLSKINIVCNQSFSSFEDICLNYATVLFYFDFKLKIDVALVGACNLQL